MYELEVGKSAFLLFDVASFWLIVYFQSVSYSNPYIWSEASVNPILGMGRLTFINWNIMKNYFQNSDNY